MPPPSKFSKDQEAAIDAMMPAWRAEILRLDPQMTGANTKLLTDWKKQAVQKLLDLEIFSNEELSKRDATLTRGQWDDVCILFI
jgi:hypothetical protein